MRNIYELISMVAKKKKKHKKKRGKPKGTKTYSPEVKAQALALYCQGYPVDRISKDYFGGRPAKKTIWQWFKKDDWQGIRELVSKKLKERSAEKVTDVKERHLKIDRAIQSVFTDNLIKGKVKPSVRDNYIAIADERILLGTDESKEGPDFDEEISIKESIQKALKEVKVT